jgi:Outer membrane lipoprotein-sorting protein
MRTIQLIIFLLISTLVANSQNARTILDNANETYNKAGGLITTFTINTQDTKSKTTYSQDGTAYLKGNRFKIDVPDGITWFDGKTQWVYAQGGDEVNVSNPTGEELAAVSPYVLLNIYKTGFKLNYKGEQKENGKNVYVIELIPESSKSEFSKIVVSIDKTSHLFSSIKMVNKNGFNNHLTIKNLKTGQSIPDNTFVFNKKEYPNVEVIDLR